MTAFHSLYEFTEEGLAVFEKAMTGELPEDVLDPVAHRLARPLDGTRAFEVRPFDTALDMATAILAALGSRPLQELLPRNGLWAWLTFVLRDTLFPRDSAGRRRLGEIHRWYPSNPNDWQKGQRHLVRMPVLLLFQLGNDADYLLCGSPAVLPEIREQMTSQQDMFHPAFQKAARALYFDQASGRLKRGTGGKGRGSPRRLAAVRQQFDVTWNLFDVSPQRLIEMLPKEFDRFKSA